MLRILSWCSARSSIVIICQPGTVSPFHAHPFHPPPRSAMPAPPIPGPFLRNRRGYQNDRIKCHKGPGYRHHRNLLREIHFSACVVQHARRQLVILRNPPFPGLTSLSIRRCDRTRERESRVRGAEDRHRAVFERESHARTPPSPSADLVR